MDPYLLVIKYIFEKNKKENVDDTLEQFFSNGLSFPQFISILYEIDQIPGVVESKNKFQIANNNMKALSFLGQKNPFFSSYSINFNDPKNQQSLIQLILNKVYFKINRPNFLKKVNDFLHPFDLKISNFSEFIQGNGFMKILNVVSNGTIPSEIKVNNNDELINSLKQHFNSLNIAIIIDKSSLMPTNQDFLMYQALIIMDQFEKASPQLNEKPSKEIGQKLPDETTEVKTNSNVKVVSFDDSESTSIDLSKKK